MVRDIATRSRLTWPQALDAMRAGAIVRRAQDCYQRLIREGDCSVPAIYESGQEGCYLAHAWTADEKAVQVFMGASSRVLFVPEDEHRSATDWIVVEKHEA